MKNKKTIVIILAIILILIAIGVCVFIPKNKKKNEISEEKEIGVDRKPDYVIQGTEKNPIKSGEFEVKKIDLFNVTDTCTEVKATIINNSDKTINGFFIEIGLYDENEKKITSVSENHEESIEPGKSYVFEASVVGSKEFSKIKNAKIISLEKDVKTELEESFKQTTSETNP